MNMASENIDSLFAEYVVAHRAGDVDPVPFIDRASTGQQDQLADLIDTYLVSAPGRDWDPEAFRGSAAERLVDPITRTLCGVSGTWPVLLPSLRNQARIKRRDLVKRLAAGLKHPGREDVVGEYYHGMEYGTLPSGSVSSRVLDVLSDILGTGVETLKQAGEVIGDVEFKDSGPVFARKPSFASEVEMTEEIVGIESQSSESRDPEAIEIERLFTGGDDE